MSSLVLTVTCKEVSLTPCDKEQTEAGWIKALQRHMGGQWLRLKTGLCSFKRASSPPFSVPVSLTIALLSLFSPCMAFHLLLSHQSLTHPLRPESNATVPVGLPLDPSVTENHSFCCIFMGFSLGSTLCALAIILCLLGT